MSEREEILRLTKTVAGLAPKLDGMVDLQNERHLNVQRGQEQNEADILNLYKMKSDDRAAFTAALKERDEEIRENREAIQALGGTASGRLSVWRSIGTVGLIIIAFAGLILSILT